MSVTLIIVSAILIQSCTKTPKPAFTYQPSTNPEAGDSIKFSNSSINATSYSWDFGDTYTSDEENPYNIYVEAGDYTVTLTASNEKKSAEVSEVITINETTVLGVFAVEDDENDSIPVGNCSVWVYDNQADWDNYNDPQFEAMTDVDGFAMFMNLEAQEYIVDLYKEVNTTDYWAAAYKLEALDLNDINLYLLPMTLYSDAKKATGKRGEQRGELTTIGKNGLKSNDK